MKGIMKKTATLATAAMLTLGLAAAPVSAASAPKIEEVDYDKHDKEVSFEFYGRVQWKNPTVKITKGGKNYVKRITEKDSDEIEVKTKKLTKGAKYHYTITGVKKKGSSGYHTIKGTFRAYDD